MTLPIVEITLYYSVVLLSPVIYVIYLKRRQKISKRELQQNILIFGTFYVLIGLLGTYALIQN